jgi:hypothetical protein
MLGQMASKGLWTSPRCATPRYLVLGDPARDQGEGEGSEVQKDGAWALHGERVKDVQSWHLTPHVRALIVAGRAAMTIAFIATLTVQIAKTRTWGTLNDGSQLYIANAGKKTCCGPQCHACGITCNSALSVAIFFLAHGIKPAYAIIAHVYEIEPTHLWRDLCIT